MDEINFEGTGLEEFRPDMPTRKRNSIIAVVKHCDREEYLCIDTTYGVRSFVMGGIEEGETPEQAALREIAEETGYINARVESVAPYIIRNKFFYPSKGENRDATLRVVFCVLKDGKVCPLSEKESADHRVVWVPRAELKNFLTVDCNLYICSVDKFFKSAYTISLGNGAVS